MEFHPDFAWKWSSKTCMKITSAECTVETQAESGWYSILTLLGSGHQKPE
jgi:hypothetical protein